MEERTWEVRITRKAEKKARRLPKRALKAFEKLCADLADQGPVLPEWPNFSKIRGQKTHWHCHLSRGRPRYVACWRVETIAQKRLHTPKLSRFIVIYYVWTHEGAPY
ncbi:MAG: hypothetical protein BMS9Abin05_2342 [Rhodothermia bacterium]|nr:MAG: hypothetical protein BMS9Abin05_2342 [Rhodothermia bacterium]